jgi:elongation factor G
MSEHQVEHLRNVVLLGHGGSGKTSLSEAMLYNAGTIARLGRIEDKNTVSDYDEEEQRRGFSVNCSILPCEWDSFKLNILDVPGYTDFIGEVKATIHAIDGAVMLICAASGVEVGAEIQWGFLEEESTPRLIFINKMDRDNASFEGILEELHAKFEKTFVPIQWPIGSQESFQGIVDLVEMKAYLGKDGKAGDIPLEVQEQAEKARTEMMEYAAEVDDDLMLKYLDGEELTNEEIREALAQGAKKGAFVLVLTGSATQNVGVKQVLDAVTSFLPNPAESERVALNMASEEELSLPPDAAGPLVAQVFKTMADPFVGKLTYFRVYSGTLVSDSRVFNVNEREEERIAQVFMVRGKEQSPVDSVKAGDIGAVTKLNVTGTSHTLCDRGAPYKLQPVIYPEPLYSVAVFPKTKGDLDKLGSSLSRLVEEDPGLRVERNAETNETILSGMGESHTNIAIRRLAQRFGVNVEAELPTIAYRETITKAASAQGRHKKQSGGHGQFGDVYCRFEPLERGEGFEFVSEIFGGSVPRNYIPAVQKGIREVMLTGVLAGFPTVDFCCALYDGSYHSVDSSEISFRLAAHTSFRNAIPEAGPVLLEPVYNVVVTIPENFMGDILGDLNTRRAQILGMEQVRDNSMVTARVPLAEIQRYATDLRSMTQGRGFYTMEFSHYDIVPARLVEKIKEGAEARRARQKERAG